MTTLCARERNGLSVGTIHSLDREMDAGSRVDRSVSSCVTYTDMILNGAHSELNDFDISLHCCRSRAEFERLEHESMRLCVIRMCPAA